MPITSAGLSHKASKEVIGTEVPDLDAMLGAGVLTAEVGPVVGHRGYRQDQFQ